MRDAVNIQAVQVVAQGLQELRDQVIFVGGSVISLYANDPAAGMPRPTSDIDLVVVVSSYAAYERLEARLRALGFQHAPEDGVICRFRFRGVLVDVMPTDVPAIGPTNRWYLPGMAHAVQYALPDGSMIKILAAPHFLATKLEAYSSRGGDMRTSKDFEDIVFLLDSRVGLMEEITKSPNELVDYLRKKFRGLLKDDAFAEAITGHLDPRISMERSEMLQDMMRKFVGGGQ